MVESVLDALPARLDDLELAVGIVRRQDPHLAGDLAVDIHDDPVLAAREPDPGVEPLVRLLAHEHVRLGRRPEPVPPHPVRAHRRVDGRVEDRRPVARPGGAVVRARHLVGQHLAGPEVLEPKRVLLAPVVVRRVREQALVGTGRERPEREVRRVPGQLVLVEQDHLVLGRRRRRRRVRLDHRLRPRRGSGPGTGCPRRSARSTTSRARRVGTDRSVSSVRLLISSKIVCCRSLRRRHHRERVRVLGLEVGQDVRVVAVAQPRVLVDDVLAVDRTRGGNGLGDGAGVGVSGIRERYATGWTRCTPARVASTNRTSSSGQ